MALDEIELFLGRDCSAVVHCRACGREHALRGVLTPGPQRGDVILLGLNYSVDDFVSISAEVNAGSGRVRLNWALPYIGGAAGLATLLRLIHH